MLVLWAVCMSVVQQRRVDVLEAYKTLPAARASSRKQLEFLRKETPLHAVCVWKTWSAIGDVVPVSQSTQQFFHALCGMCRCSYTLACSAPYTFDMPSLLECVMARCVWLHLLSHVSCRFCCVIMSRLGPWQMVSSPDLLVACNIGCIGAT